MTLDDEDAPTTQELRLDQIQRAREEKARADAAATPAEQHAAERRAEKAQYLRRKLDEQEAREQG